MTKRITIIVASVAAIMLPVIASAQVLNPPSTGTGSNSNSGYNEREIVPWTAGVSQFGGTGGEPIYAPTVDRSAASGRTLADDLHGGVDFSVSNNPISACSGLDIRDSIKGMLDLSSLADDVKNYLTSLLAKQALSLVYANPAIAGVLDGLKAFGNARFQLAQSSCEAIEGEISAQSRYLRQEAFKKCISERGDDKQAIYDCSVETGNYTQALSQVANDAQTAINSSIYSWTSRVNILTPDTKGAMCRQLGANAPAACARADQVNAAIPQPVVDKEGNVRGTNPPMVSPSALSDEAFRNALGANAVYMGTMLGAVNIFNGDMFAANDAIERIAAKRKAAYAAAIGTNGVIMADAVRDIYNRDGGERNFVGAARQMTVRMAADIMSRYPGCSASEFEDGDIAPVHGQATGRSYHYSGQAIDFNCSGNESGSLARMYAELNARRGELGIVELIYGSPGHEGHLHVAFGSPGEGPSTYSQMVSGPLREAADITGDIVGAMAAAASATTFEAKLAKLEQALKSVPLVTEDACYYELDGKPQTGLEDIRDITKIFALNTVANQMAERARYATSAESGPPAGASQVTGDIMSSMSAKVQELNLTVGRLSLCNIISYTDRLNLMKTQYLTNQDGLAYIRSLSEVASNEATLTLYDGLIHQVNMARAMASNSDAPPAIDTGFVVALESLKTMRTSVEKSMDARKAMAARQAMIDSVLKQRREEAQGELRKQGSTIGDNVGRR